jgi:hypothetical protein
MKGSTKVASLPSAPAFCRKRASRRRSPPLLPRTTTKRLAPEDAALSLRPAEASANRSLADTLGVRPKQASQHPSGDARSRAESERDALRREQHHLDRRCPDDRLFRHRELLKQMLDLAPRRATAAWSATASGSSRAPCPAAPSYSASWAARPATAPTCARRTRRSRAGSTPRRTQPRWSSRYSIGVTVDRKGTLETVDEPAAR